MKSLPVHPSPKPYPPHFPSAPPPTGHESITPWIPRPSHHPVTHLVNANTGTPAAYLLAVAVVLFLIALVCFAASRIGRSH